MKRSKYNWLNTAALLGAILLSSSAPGATTLLYNFDGNTNDSSGNGYNGSVTGAEQYGTGLISGSSFDFDGSTYISTGQQAATLGITGATWTASARINADTLGGDKSIFGQDGGATSETLHLIVRGTQPLFGQYSNDTGGNRILETNHVYDLVWRFDNGEQAIFVNGVRDAASAGHAQHINTGNNILVGRWGGGNTFDGRIDGATIESTAASVSSIQTAAALNVPASERFSLTLAGTSSTGMRARKVDGVAADVDASQTNLVGGSLPGNGVGLFSSVNMSNAGQGLFSGGTSFPGGGGDNYSTEVTGLLYVPAPGIYVLGTRSDDSARIQIGKSLLILDEFRGDAGDAIVQRTVNFAEAGYYPYRVIHREAGGGEHLEFFSGVNTAGAVDVGGGFTDLVGDTANGGLQSIATGSFYVRDVKSTGTIGDLAAAEALMSGTGVQSTTTGYYGIIDFKDSTSGATEHFTNNLAFPGGQGSGGNPDNRNNYALEATTNIWITEAGTYTFGFNHDDGGKLTINGIDVITDDVLSDLHDKFGQITFSQPGFYPLRYLFFEQGGGSGMELFASKGSHTSFGSAGAAFRLLGDVGNGGIAVFIPEPSSFALFGIAAATMIAGRRRRRRT